MSGVMALLLLHVNATSSFVAAARATTRRQPAAGTTTTRRSTTTVRRSVWRPPPLSSLSILPVLLLVVGGGESSRGREDFTVRYRGWRAGEGVTTTTEDHAHEPTGNSTHSHNKVAQRRGLAYLEP